MRERLSGDARSLRGPGLLLGVALGGLFDGIVLHQILQWHHLLSSTGEHPVTSVEGLEVNTLADGLFHALTYVALLAGVWLLWRAVRGGIDTTGATLVGWMLAGWGAFNLVEGTVDHHILQIHHVKAGPNQMLYDLGFLASGLLLLVVGMALARRRDPELTPGP